MTVIPGAAGNVAETPVASPLPALRTCSVRLNVLVRLERAVAVAAAPESSIDVAWCTSTGAACSTPFETTSAKS